MPNEISSASFFASIEAVLQDVGHNRQELLEHANPVQFPGVLREKARGLDGR